MMASCLVSLYKALGVRPVGIGEIIRPLLTKCDLLVIGATEIETCGNLDLCAILGVGIKGAVQTTPSDYRKV